jgi:hypothetical protein
MKKYLPLILLFAGIVVVVLVFVVLRGKDKEVVTDGDEGALIEVALKDRPVVSLTPTGDGHYLNLKVTEINIPKAETMEYELLYEVPGGVTQGVPGSVDIASLSSYETEMLLGSESSGKFRYDEGVEEGTITIRFRNRDGKLLVKFSSDFLMKTETKRLESKDGEFSCLFDSTPDGYYVVMPTIGFPGKDAGSVKKGPYGVFGSASVFPEVEVTVDGGDAYIFEDGDWKMLEDNKSESIGIFVSAS